MSTDIDLHFGWLPCLGQGCDLSAIEDVWTGHTTKESDVCMATHAWKSAFFPVDIHYSNDVVNW